MRAASLALWLIGLGLGGCGALLDIDDIEFGDPPPPAGPQSSSQGTGGGLTVGGSGPGGQPPNETCGNGLDEDGDGLIDCEDESCSGHLCVPAPPAGWDPTTLELAAEPAPCPTDWPDATDGGAGPLIAPPASCASCTCEDPTGGTCALPSFTLYAGLSCGGGSLPVTVTAADTCLTVNSPTSDSARGFAISPVLAGSCAPLGGEPTLEPATFTVPARVCDGGSSGAGCEAGEICVPPAERLDHCIRHAGDVPCPGGPYQERQLVYRTIDDQRSCAPCSCDTPTGLACVGHTNLYSDTACATLNAVAMHNGSCTPATGGNSSYIHQLDSGPGGSCAPNGGAPIGDATAADPVTICCL